MNDEFREGSFEQKLKRPRQFVIFLVHKTCLVSEKLCKKTSLIEKCLFGFSLLNASNMCTSPIRQFAPTSTCTSPRPGGAPTSSTAARPRDNRTSGDLTCFFGDVKGLVVGAFGEGSEDLHALIHHLATSRVKRLGPKREREVSEDGGGRAGHHHLLPEEDLKLQF